MSDLTPEREAFIREWGGQSPRPEDITDLLAMLDYANDKIARLTEERDRAEADADRLAEALREFAFSDLDVMTEKQDTNTFKRLYNAMLAALAAHDERRAT